MRSFLFKKNFRGYTMFLRVISSFLFFFAENIREVNLIIEQGNTSSKVAVYKNGHIEASFVYKQFGVSVVAALFEKYAFTQGILSTVIDTDDELIAYLKNKLQRFVFLDEHVALPIKGGIWDAENARQGPFGRCRGGELFAAGKKSAGYRCRYRYHV